MSHRYSFWQIIEWWLHGLTQKIRVTVPSWVMNPLPEDGVIPDFWWDHYSWQEWHSNIDDDYIPNAAWVWYWQTAIRYTLQEWVEEVGEWGRDEAIDLVRDFTGYVAGGFATFSGWISTIEGRVGSWVPSFTTTLANGLNHIWNLVPQPVRDGLQSFATWVDGFIEDVKAWARDRYDAAKQWASDALSWVQSAGQTLKTWWDERHAWLDDLWQNFTQRVREAIGAIWGWLQTFYNDPYGTVVGWLGDPWGKVVTFAQGAFTFWYNLWSEHGDDLGEFLTNPFWFVYDRVESWIIENIW